MAIVLNGSTGITTPSIDSSGGDIAATSLSVAGSNISAANSMGFRNRIINGDMVTDQRNAGAAVTTTGTFTLDRWFLENATDATISIQQSSTAPAGFSNSLSVTVSSGDASIGATQYASIRQVIEGYNISDFGFGTANAKTITLSFWVRSSVTGTLSGTLRGASNGQFYPYTYTVSSANTWEYKTVTISGATAGTWGSTNNEGMRVYFTFASGSTYQAAAGSWTTTTCLGATGSTNIAETTGATLYITGVQLEVGSVATEFERRPYGTELALCQRYCYKLMPGIQLCKMRELDRSRQGFYVFPVQMRTTATVGSMSTTDGISVTINNQSDRGFSMYCVVPGDGYGAEINTQALVTAEL